MKIALVGAPSSRKSTVADYLNALLKMERYNSQVCGEYAVDYLLEHSDDGKINYVHEQLLILEGQIKKEDKIAPKREITVCDAASFLSYIYARLLVRGERPLRRATVKVLKDVHEKSIQHAQTYDAIYLFPPAEYVNDGVRYQTGKEEQEHIYAMIKGFMDVECIPYLVVDGTVEGKAQFILGDVKERIGFVNK